MIKLIEIVSDILAEKKLCPKGKAYYNRRKAAGEKPSAYLSGRAVKVCKGLMEEEITELRQGLLGYLKQQLPNFPDYVIKDWIYKMIKKDDNINTAEGIQDWIDTQLKDLKWETKTNFPITMDIFGDKTQKELKSRIGGEIRQDVGKDIERHKTQQNLLKSQGISKEPIIIFKTKSGKYELGEGWHRTTQAFKMYPEGFIQPNVYIGLNAKWLNESLRDWFKKEDWVRIDTAGNITGPCGTMKKGNKTTRCLPRAKANSLTKAERAATSKKKAASSKQFVPNTKKAKVRLSEIKNQTIECEKCSWKWDLANGGQEPYLCHKCGYDNSYRYNNDIDEYDVENKQDLKEFIVFIKEYNQMLSEGCDCLLEAEYRGRKVTLGKIMQGDIKKFKVYVKNNKGKVVKVNFGFGGKSAKGKRMVIKAKNPKRRAAYRARHNCDNPGPRWKANYWSCRKW